MAEFEHFYQDLKKTEKEDAILTSSQQIDRLLRPGSTYLNLVSREVLLRLRVTPLEPIRGAANRPGDGRGGRAEEVQEALAAHPSW